MDPFSIACECIGLSTGVAHLLMRISVFVSEVRSARKDMEVVTRELVSLQLCLEALRDDEQQRHVTYPKEIRTQIRTILMNIELMIDEMRKVLSKLSSGRMGRRVQWALTEHDEISKLRSSLESNKLALEVILTVGTISILMEQQKAISKQRRGVAVLMQQTASIAERTERIDRKLDVLGDIHKDTNKITLVGDEIQLLRTQFLELTQKANQRQNLNVFMNEARTWTQMLVQPADSLRPIAEGLDRLESCSGGVVVSSDGDDQASSVYQPRFTPSVLAKGMLKVEDHVDLHQIKLVELEACTACTVKEQRLAAAHEQLQGLTTYAEDMVERIRAYEAENTQLKADLDRVKEEITRLQHKIAKGDGNRALIISR